MPDNTEREADVFPFRQNPLLAILESRSPEPADHVDHASARRHAREAATTEAWRDSEE